MSRSGPETIVRCDGCRYLIGTYHCTKANRRIFVGSGYEQDILTPPWCPFRQQQSEGAALKDFLMSQVPR
jgi:hypothetical protein